MNLPAALNLVGPLERQTLGERAYAKLADLLISGRLAPGEKLSLRAGCHCNPGAREAALGLDASELRRRFRDAPTQTYDEFMRAIAGQTAGVVRASLGPVTTFGDVYRFASFLVSFVDLSRSRDR